MNHHSACEVQTSQLVSDPSQNLIQIKFCESGRVQRVQIGKLAEVHNVDLVGVCDAQFLQLRQLDVVQKSNSICEGEVPQLKLQSAAGRAADVLQSGGHVCPECPKQFPTDSKLRFESGNVQLRQEFEAPDQEELVLESVHGSFEHEVEFLERTQLGQTPEAGFGHQVGTNQSVQHPAWKLLW